ncbi:hypothetical protein [Croceiramulus getboli]|nr:outer membrane beta-barrel protein [Flavobacteriaceae bacterium YJPT1-3]
MRQITLLLFFLFSLAAWSQGYQSQGYNLLGAQGKYAIMNIQTDDFVMESSTGFQGGLTGRGAWYNNFDMIFGIDLMSAGVTSRGTSLLGVNEEIEYRMIGAQVNLQLAYNILGQHLSIFAGPTFMLNGELELDNADQASHVLDGYTTLQAQDIQDISRFHLLATVGIAGGLEKIRLIAQYQYGVLNTFERLNKENVSLQDPEARDLKGNLGILSAGLVFYL